MKRRIIYALVGLLLFCFLTMELYQKFSGPEADYFEPKVIATHFNGIGYVGSTTCLECHEDIYKSHIHSPHFNTSKAPLLENIKGSFEKGKNTLSLEGAEMVMTNTGNGPFQNALLKYGDRNEFNWSMDIVIGSGVKGQSYLTRQPEGLFQLQASYYTPSDSWINSPNYSKRLTPLRPVNDQCLKCHVTFAEKLKQSGSANQYDISKIVLGVDCERCHGPAQKHVEYQRNNLGATNAPFMVKIDSLSNQRQLDLCASCHSGLRNNQVLNPFKFLPGDTLSNFSKNYAVFRPNANLDVHGNQYGLLTSSKCFKESAAMNCTTCHDPHTNQRGDFLYFNAKCMECHGKTTVQCSSLADKMDQNEANCIQCHMPVTDSKSMQLQVTKEKTALPVGVRTHYIAIYSDEKTPGRKK